MNKKWLRPLEFGVFCTLIFAAPNALGIIRSHHYLGNHLYNTAAEVLLNSIDRQALYVCCITSLLWLILWANGRAQGLVRIIWTTASVLVGMTLVFVLLSLSGALKGLDLASVKEAIFASVGLILPALIGVVGLLYLLRRMRRSFTITEGTRGADVVIEKPGQMSLIFSPFLFIFLAFNLVALVLHIHTAVTGISKPNVILIMVDTLRADHLGCYGYQRNTSPNIDELAKHSIRFNTAISQASWTVPSVASFMTSRYPQTILSSSNGEKDSSWALPLTLSNRFATMAEILRDRGYATAGIISNDTISTTVGWERGFDYSNVSQCNESVSSPGLVPLNLKWLDKNRENRFFLFTLFFDPHTPYVKHKEYDFDPEYRGPYMSAINQSEIRPEKHCSLDHMRAMYDSEIALTDNRIGRLLSGLKKRGLYDKSLIIFLSDHGEEMGDHGGVFHGHTLYKELTHVPLIIKLPNQTKGRVVKGLYPLIDLLPSVLAAIGYDSDTNHFAGKAVPLSNVSAMRDELVFSMTNFQTHNLRSVQNSRHKYVLSMDGSGDKLFDLISDSLEMHDISKSDQAVVSGLKKIILDKERTVNRVKDASDEGSGKDLTGREIEKLKSLGYAQ